MAGQWSRLATAPEMEQQMMTGSSTLTRPPRSPCRGISPRTDPVPLSPRAIRMRSACPGETAGGGDPAWHAQRGPGLPGRRNTATGQLDEPARDVDELAVGGGPRPVREPVVVLRADA